MLNDEIKKGLCSKINLFCNNNMQTVVTRINKYFQRSGKTFVVVKVNKTLAVDPFDAIITDFKYSKVSTIINPVLAFDENVHNPNPDVAIDVEVEYEKIMEEDFMFSFNEDILIGASAKVTAGLPIIGQGEVSVYGEVSFGNSKSWVKKLTRRWANKNSVKINPNHSENIKVFINNTTIDSPFIAKYIMGPKTWILLYLDVQDGTKRDFWIPISELFTEAEILDQLSFSLSGKFNGTEGIGVDLKITPISITSDMRVLTGYAMH